MQTPYDWITVLIFAGLVTHFLATSAKPEHGDVSIWHYLLPSVACAGANWLGNGGRDIAAVLVLAAAGFYIFQVFGSKDRLPPEG